MKEMKLNYMGFVWVKPLQILGGKKVLILISQYYIYNQPIIYVYT